MHMLCAREKGRQHRARARFPFRVSFIYSLHTVCLAILCWSALMPGARDSISMNIRSPFERPAMCGRPNRSSEMHKQPNPREPWRQDGKMGSRKIGKSYFRNIIPRAACTPSPTMSVKHTNSNAFAGSSAHVGICRRNVMSGFHRNY